MGMEQETGLNNENHNQKAAGRVAETRKGCVGEIGMCAYEGRRGSAGRPTTPPPHPLRIQMVKGGWGKEGGYFVLGHGYVLLASTKEREGERGGGESKVREPRGRWRPPGSFFFGGGTPGGRRVFLVRWEMLLLLLLCGCLLNYCLGGGEARETQKKVCRKQKWMGGGGGVKGRSL